MSNRLKALAIELGIARPSNAVDLAVAEADWDTLRFQTRSVSSLLGTCLMSPFPDPFTYVRATVTIDGQILVFFVFTVAAAEAAATRRAKSSPRSSAPSAIAMAAMSAPSAVVAISDTRAPGRS